MTIPKKWSTTQRRTPIPPINQDRYEKNYARTFHSSERVEFGKRRPCVICGARPCDNAHIEVDGMSRRAGYDKIVSLCTRTHHRELDTTDGRAAFEAKYSVDLDAEAARHQADWLVYAAREGFDP